jgi:hypothetical protein
MQVVDVSIMSEGWGHRFAALRVSDHKVPDRRHEDHGGSKTVWPALAQSASILRIHMNLARVNHRQDSVLTRGQSPHLSLQNLPNKLATFSKGLHGVVIRHEDQILEHSDRAETPKVSLTGPPRFPMHVDKDPCTLNTRT